MFTKTIIFFLKNIFQNKYCISYSQNGEDIILNYYLRKKKGLYVDVGCHEPVVLNNTHLFYENGWKGINIDANPEYIEKFNLVRKRDINVCALVGNSNKTEKFYIFDPGTLSTISQKQKRLYLKAGYKLKKVINIPCVSLSSLLEQNLSNAKIDFFSIDTEGSEMEVLRSNNWELYRPKFVMLEVTQHKPIIKNTKPFDTFFKKIQYTRFADTPINAIYISYEYMKELQIKII